MIIIGNNLYTIHELTKGEIVVVFLLIIIPIIFFICIGIYNKITKSRILEDNPIFSIIAIACIIALVIGIGQGIHDLKCYIKAPRDEVVLYAGMVEQGKVMREIIALDKSELLTDSFYQQVINFNKQLTINQEYVNNPEYAPMRWHMNWASIPKILLLQVTSP